jgi:hypothetical protein
MFICGCCDEYKDKIECADLTDKYEYICQECVDYKKIFKSFEEEYKREKLCNRIHLNG